ncbi:hypothetical protein CSV63_12805 [Sporosarcina sp. P34]|uniref:flagellin N-terminal helical domain-containing protein n=1 Tax=Sporosarcina sp. P34 TaxID=2048247 RepID=UPI000C16C178|nr:flagellin [Sporosarcina sp. P34]PID14401.1 hypothetical protein CSV63_12805 [Sporosarcina sp. P34]
MRINHNLQALRAWNDNTKIMKKSENQLEKLSSGLFINKAADDAAGLAISEKMRAQIRGLERAQMNTQDAVSYVQTADGVVQEVTQHIQRMRELTVQSLNDTLTDSDRRQLDAEFGQLKKSISDITEFAQYNGELNSVDQHMPAFSKLTGNRIFNQPIQVIPGWNDRLVIVAEPDEYTVTLPEGNFEKVEDLIDQIDTQVYKDYPNIIFNVQPDHSVSVQVENHKDITKVKGPGSFLFYEYELGNPPGMIVGSTDFSTGNNKLEIIAGVNDRLSFYAGATKKFELVIPTPTVGHPDDRRVSYTRDEMVDIVNAYLQSQGEDEIIANKFGDRYISISSDKYVITGLSGNMIKIDGISSFLYDISNTGSVSKTNGTYYGSAYLQPGSTEFIKGQNDTLFIELNNQAPMKISLLQLLEGSANLTGTQIVSRINTQFKLLGLDAEASMSGNRVKLESNYYGSSSRITVSTASPAYESLFTREEVYFGNPSSYAGGRSDAILYGNYKERSETVITDQNNTLSIKVGGEELTLTLDEGVYGAVDLVAHLNTLLPEDNSLKFQLSTSGAKQAIHLAATDAGKTIAFNDQSVASNAFETLFGGDRVVDPSYTSGTTSAPVPPPEGTVGESQITKTSAKVTGNIDLTNGLTITDGENTLSFYINNEEFTVTLSLGSYTKDTLVASINAQLADTPVRAEITGANRLALVSNEQGRHMQFRNVAGIGMERFVNVPNSTQVSTVLETVPSVTGYAALKNEPIIIDSSNNDITFTYIGKSGEETINVAVPMGTYTNRDNFVSAINDQLTLPQLDKFQFEISSGSIQLIGKEAGIGTEFKGMGGKLYEEFFRKQEYTYSGYGYSGNTTRKDETYILGRQPLGSTIEIFPNINEVLTFDIYKNNEVIKVDVTVPPNTYTRNQFVTAFNTALKEGLKTAGLEEDLMKAQIGMSNTKPPSSYDKSDKFVLLFNEHNDGRNDSGTYQIQGVRGTAAYTYFYNSQGDPKPSYVIGITDLSEGATIEAGVNDEFTLDIDDITKKFTIPAGNYSQGQLLEELNNLLDIENTGIIASYDNNKLKFSNREYGAIPIDGFAGSARDFLFFRTERREDQAELNFQVGANSNQSIEYNRVRLSEQLLRVNTLTVSHRMGAEKALERLSLAISSLTEKSGYLGATQNRLDHVIRVNSVNIENLVAAESRIRDADMAKELLEKAKNDILMQANQSVLAKAGAHPQGILDMLK